MSRQNYYKVRIARERRMVDEGLIRDLVQATRKEHPRLGGFKLHYLLKDELLEAGVRIGRDRFFEVLGNQGLLLEPRRKAPRTTNSRHSLPVFPNLIKTMEITGPNQVWVCDITYIRTREGFLYLYLITDIYSKKIVGYHLGRTLEAADAIKALRMALKHLPEDEHPIHHSDRGCQYCSHEYVEVLRESGLAISMTEENHCAENSIAERVNGILKNEYYIDAEFRTEAAAAKAVEQTVYLYNTKRPHRSLKLCTPEAVHSRAA
jgi:transposase InsO family protein